MKRILLIMLCSVFAFSMAYAQDAKKTKNAKETVTFYVDGMDCAGCQKKIEKNISFVRGVTDLKSDLATKTVVVTFDQKKTTEKKLMDAFKKIGMPAETIQP